MAHNQTQTPVRKVRTNYEMEEKRKFTDVPLSDFKYANAARFKKKKKKVKK